MSFEIVFVYLLVGDHETFDLIIHDNVPSNCFIFWGAWHCQTADFLCEETYKKVHQL
jgi:hypothetical protein